MSSSGLELGLLSGGSECAFVDIGMDSAVGDDMMLAESDPSGENIQVILDTSTKEPREEVPLLRFELGWEERREKKSSELW